MFSGNKIPPVRSFRHRLFDNSFGFMDIFTDESDDGETRKRKCAAYPERPLAFLSSLTLVASGSPASAQPAWERSCAVCRKRRKARQGVWRASDRRASIRPRAMPGRAPASAGLAKSKGNYQTTPVLLCAPRQGGVPRGKPPGAAPSGGGAEPPWGPQQRGVRRQSRGTLTPLTLDKPAGGYRGRARKRPRE